MKMVVLIHKEHDTECFEVLNRCLAKDKDLKTLGIEENTLIQKLPKKIVIKFLKLLHIKKQARDLIIRFNKSGTLFIEFEEVVVYDD